MALHMNPHFTARVQRICEIDPATREQIIEAFFADTPMAQLAAATGLSQAVLNKLYTLPWNIAFTETPMTTTRKNRKQVPREAPLAPAQAPTPAALLEHVQTLTALRIGAADMCTWLHISPAELSQAKAYARSISSADTIHTGKSPTNAVF